MALATMAEISANDEHVELLLSLYKKSVLKQAKYSAIENLLSDPSSKTLLDIGADNGVISYLLREKGGRWSSADLSAQTVDSIKSIVGERVYQINAEGTPFQDNEFDCVVIIDALEHVHEDCAFVEEMQRITKPGGQLIINVPHAKRGSVIRAIRLAVGLTDAKHGHVRPGYTQKSLENVLNEKFRINQTNTYSRFFVELFDIAMSLALEVMGGGHGLNDGVNKGNVVTGEDLKKNQKKFKMFSLIYPVVKLCSYLDKLLFFTKGHSLIVSASSTKSN